MKRKNRKTIATIIVTVLSLSLITAVALATTTTSAEATIEKIRVYESGSVAIFLESNPCPDNNTSYKIGFADTGAKQQLSLAISAFLSGRQIKINFDYDGYDSGDPECFVNYIQIEN